MSAIHHLIAILVLFGVGAALGSFLNVCAYRLPRSLSVIRPSSRCPRCGAGIRPSDNVPVLGWIFLRGRCRSCRLPISARYPIVEAAVGLLLVCSYLAAGPADPLELGLTRCVWVLAYGLIASAFLVTGTLIVLDGARVPVAVATTGMGVAVLLGALRSNLAGESIPLGLLDPVLGLVTAGGTAWIVRTLGEGLTASWFILRPGDLAFAAMVGAWVGFQAILPVLAIALLLVPIGLAVQRYSHRGLRTSSPGAGPEGGRFPMPFGLALGLSALLPILAGPWLGPLSS